MLKYVGVKSLHAYDAPTVLVHTTYRCHKKFL